MFIAYEISKPLGAQPISGTGGRELPELPGERAGRLHDELRAFRAEDRVWERSTGAVDHPTGGHSVIAQRNLDDGGMLGGGQLGLAERVERFGLHGHLV